MLKVKENKAKLQRTFNDKCYMLVGGKNRWSLSKRYSLCKYTVESIRSRICIIGRIWISRARARITCSGTDVIRRRSPHPVVACTLMGVVSGLIHCVQYTDRDARTKYPHCESYYNCNKLNEINFNMRDYHVHATLSSIHHLI